MPEWITSKHSTALGVDEFFQDYHYEEFLECVEALMVSQEPHIRIPSLQHMRKLPGLCIMPQTNQFLHRSHYLTSDNTIASRSIRILHTLVNRIKRDWSSDSVWLEIHNLLRETFIPTNIRSKRLRPNGSVSMLSFERLVKEVEASEKEHDIEREKQGQLSSSLDSENEHQPLEKGEPLHKSRSSSYPASSYQSQVVSSASYYDLQVPDLFDDARRCWKLIGWIFQCSSIDDSEFKYRWRQLQPFLQVVIDFLELDELIMTTTSQNCKLTDMDVSNHSIIKLWTDFGGVHHSEIIRSILSTVNEDGTSEFSPLLQGEPDNFPINEVNPCSHECIFLRSRLFDLVITSYKKDNNITLYKEQRLEEFIDDTIHYFTKDYLCSMLMPKSFNHVCTLSRLAWCTCLDSPNRFLYITGIIDYKLAKAILSIKPRRYLVFSHPQDTVISLIKLQVDLICRLYSAPDGRLSGDNSSDNHQQLISAYKKGHQLRLEWLAKRQHKSKPHISLELQQLESSLEGLIKCFIQP